MHQKERAQQLASLHVKGSPLLLYNAWDAGSAKAVAEFMQHRRLLRRAGHVQDPPGHAVELPGRIRMRSLKEYHS